MTRGQAATEFLIILGVALIVLIAIMVVVLDFDMVNKSVLQRHKAVSVVNDLAKAAELVYRQGLGSTTKVEVIMPENVNHYNFSGNLIQLNVALEENRDIYRTVDFQVSGGSVATNGGNKIFYLESGKDFVFITENVNEAAEYCGNNKQEGGEQCDGGDLVNQACTTQGYDSGTLACLSTCLFDYTGCAGFGTAPDSVSNIVNDSEGADWIYWTWNNPINPDFDTNIVFVNGTNVVNTSNAFYRATSLTPGTVYNITIHTMDSGGNINNTELSQVTSTGIYNYLGVVAAQSCNAEDNANKGSLSSACDGSYPADCSASDDLLSCNDGNSETHTANKVSGTSYYGGVNVTSFNATITDCTNISTVLVCYEWWANGGLSDCDISVDANEGTSFTSATAACPGESADPGVTCVDVTTAETWTCENFFNATGVNAAIKSEAQQNAGAATVIVTWDTLYYNISYTIN